MNNITIGAIIATLRYEKGYSRMKLSKGVCSTQMLIKIESDKVDVDKFMLDVLLQRLGKSPDKLEVILSDEEYEKIFKRDYIEELIWKNKKDDVTTYLKAYEEQYASDSNVQKMFVLRMKAYVAHNLDHEIEKAETYIRQAIEMTLPGIDAKNFNNYLIAGIELENLLELVYCLTEQEKNAEAEELLTVCQEYIEANISDEVEYSKVFSKSAWLFARLLAKKEAYMKAYQICEDAMGCLRKYGIMYFMIPLLEQMIFCGEKIGLDLDKSKWKIYYDILSELYQNYGESWYCHNSLFHNCYQTVYHLASEFIRLERHAKELTQEQLIEGVYEAPENLSRVECGKSIPTKKKFEGLMDNLGIERGKYCGTLVVEDFEMLELKYEIDILIGTEKYEEAQNSLNELISSLDCNRKMNRMAVEIYQIMIDIGTNKVSVESAYETLSSILEDTLLLKNGKMFRVPFYNELLALNMMSICLKKLDRKKDAVSIYEGIINAIEASKIDEKYQNNIMSLILANENLDDASDALSDRGISYDLHCGKGKMLYLHFASQIELAQDKETRREVTRLAYYLSDLFLRGNNRLKLKQGYEQEYGEQLM